MTREELIAAMVADGADKPVKVTIRRWGDVYVRSPSVEEAENQKTLPDDEAEQHTLARAAALVICDESGKRVFDPLSHDDIALLSKRRAVDLRVVLNAAQGDPEGN